MDQTEKPWNNLYTINLDVTPGQTLLSNTSNELKMDAKPRGVALIFVTVPELALEAERYRSIFQQLLFEPVICPALTRDQTVAKLSEMADTNTKYKGDAFIMMFIGHGYNERIIGWSAFPQWPPAPRDVLPIRDIVAMFSKTRCRPLAQKAKLFIFNTCSEMSGTECVAPGFVNSQSIDTMASLDTNWKNDNKLTHVIYACSQGSKAWHEPVNGAIGHVSVFGQALSHTIAQYSWQKNLYQLFVMSVNRMEEELKRMDKTNCQTEIKMVTVDKKLFFNPGLCAMTTVLSPPVTMLMARSVTAIALVTSIATDGDNTVRTNTERTLLLSRRDTISSTDTQTVTEP
ncbi:unnamed protein product [Medioppia subpectinata]|uniref:Caspase family p20 domain-containing protein n=1 Tax=Medioppia subpectinata TaxID=1979941 RepID=A0A7R9Q7W6_9ACAR|nr:unnamed protein product [Medioppia subpectinata]CAG2116271.1 unnamed protein product [Medioppia subpectinata]